MKTTITLKLGDAEHTIEAANFMLLVEDEDGSLTTSGMVGGTEAVGWAKADMFRKFATTLAEDPIVELKLLGQQILGVYQGWKRGVHEASDARRKKR